MKDGIEKSLDANGEPFRIHSTELSEWSCYLSGNRPGGLGLVWRPLKGKRPNWFVRWMMLVFFDCLWVKDKQGEG